MALSKAVFPPSGWERKGGSQLFGLMSAFDSTPPGGRGRLYCPWLEAWHRLHGPEKPPSEGILLMQDWNVSGPILEPFEEAVDLLLICLAQGANSPAARSLGPDRTLQNLLPKPREGWSKAFVQGHWLITNAVWGLRPNGSKSGYLGKPIHSAAFPIWRLLVVSAAWANLCAATSKRFTLIVAGGWGRNPPPAKNPDDLPSYLQVWEKYVGNKVTGQPVAPDAGVLYTTHPSMWRTQNLSRELLVGPPHF